MLSRLDIKVQTLATEHRRRYEVWCSNQCTLSMAELFKLYLLNLLSAMELRGDANMPFNEMLHDIWIVWSSNS